MDARSPSGMAKKKGNVSEIDSVISRNTPARRGRPGWARKTYFVPRGSDGYAAIKRNGSRLSELTGKISGVWTAFIVGKLGTRAFVQSASPGYP